MKALRKDIIIKFDINQKETIQYGTLKLFIPSRDGLSENARESWATSGTVLESKFDGIGIGDEVLFVHTILENEATWISKTDSEIIMRIPTDGSCTIYGKIGSKGEVIPMFGNVVCKRIDEAPMSNIIITPDAYKKAEPTKGVVICQSSDSGYIEGQTICYFPYSDYELCYMYKNEEKKAIMVKKEDIVGYIE